MSTEHTADELCLVLRKPITIGDVVFTHVDLEEPSGEQLEKLSSRGGWGDLFEMISIIGNVPPQVPRKMKQRDLERAADFFAGFSSAKGAASSSLGASTAPASADGETSSTASPRN